MEAGRAVLESYGYGEIELPLLEKGELFSRSVGATSDIVEKEMYAFEDRDGTMVALRPEGTASVVRAYIEGGLTRAMPVARLYYTGPMFRRERPQKGRYRQFTQIGAEFLGRDDPSADAETICLVADICEAAGVSDARIDINSLGDEGCRPAYREALSAFGRERIESLCEDCKKRLERNPLRLLDCKVESCAKATADAPMMIDHLCASCRSHHERVLELLAAAGVKVESNPRMVRGLDYYCRTAFEIIGSGLGSQDAIGGGGRYDGLVAALGGPDLAGVGFAFGVERMEMAATDAGEQTRSPEMFIAPVDEVAAEPALVLARRLRRCGSRVELGSPLRRLRAQMKQADKAGARYVIILGADELAAGRATVRDMVNNSDHTALFALDDEADKIIETIGRVGESGA